MAAAVPIGDAHVWIIGRDPLGVPATEPYFGLIDEGSKLNLNCADTNMLAALPNMTADFAAAIVQWRAPSDGGASALNYAPLNYAPKNAPFETAEELRLVYGATLDALVGEDANRNGVLDENEADTNRNGQVDPGLLEYVTTFSREPNTRGDGTPLVNVNDRTALAALLQTRLGAARADQVLAQLAVPAAGGRNGGTSRPAAYANLLAFYLRSQMSPDKFALIADGITASGAQYIYGRLNVNTAGAVVLACLPGMDFSAAQQLLEYRQANPDKLASIAWIVDALGATSAAVQTLARGDFLTTRSYQFTADIAALGPFGRGYRRTQFVFDLSAGNVQVIYRRDLTGLGWALGQTVRETWLAKNTERDDVEP